MISFFFFSSRRGHTRFKCDWSSDVCSSDLGYVCGGAGMRLNVGVFRAEEFFGAIDRELFDLVRVFAAAVVTLARIALGVLVGKNPSHGFENGFGDEIFRWDEFEA